MSITTDAIIQASTDAGIVGVSYANLQEFQSFQDSFNFNDYPRNIVVPLSINGRFSKVGQIKKNIPLKGWVLTRISEDTNDWRTLALEDSYIDPMRQLALQFIWNLLNDDNLGIDPETDDVTFTIDPEYMFLPAHLFGVSYTVNIPSVGRKC